jgi:hypothetical protein
MPSWDEPTRTEEEWHQAQKRIATLEAALEIIMADVGWRGDGDSEEYHCEYCKQHHEHPAQIEHHPGCKLTRLRRVRIGGEF